MTGELGADSEQLTFQSLFSPALQRLGGSHQDGCLELGQLERGPGLVDGGAVQQKAGLPGRLPAGAPPLVT